MERLKNMKNTLMGCVEGQLGNLQETDTHELGEAIDMIKDLEEAMYYCSITKAMEKAEKEEEMMEKMGMRREQPRYYGGGGSGPRFPEIYYPYPYDRDMDRDMGRMYYSERQPRNEQGEFMSTRNNSRGYYGGDGGSNSGSSGGGQMSGGNGGSSNGGGGRGYYTERELPFELRDMREGRSGASRRSYMESKQLHRDKEDKMKDLERYMKELTEDIVEMIEGASSEEKQMLEKKLTQLTTKVSQLNV